MIRKVFESENCFFIFLLFHFCYDIHVVMFQILIVTGGEVTGGSRESSTEVLLHPLYHL